jgi:GTP-binding protein LepA
MNHLSHIRNFSIIAHIDHGKSTLADRMLEITKTIDPRKMGNQMLDTMELEKERGITIKMRPVRMEYIKNDEMFVLNLIDTPGHIDFSYEVSRALKAVEGCLLLVDATQGIQAQTLTTLEMAQKTGLTIIPVLTKIDAPNARVDDMTLEIAGLLQCDIDDVLFVSGKTGEGVEHLLNEIVARIPSPRTNLENTDSFSALIFDFEYSNHQGIIVYARVFDGNAKRGDTQLFCASEKQFNVTEVGTFRPGFHKDENLSAGSIGYIVTGIKEAGAASVGDTLTLLRKKLPALAGYGEPEPVVWASMYPESQDDFDSLRLSLSRLKLSDSSLRYEEEASGILGRGFRCGFLGMLHLEIIAERLRREFNLDLILTTPTVIYCVTTKNGETTQIYTPMQFPNYGDIKSISEPWIKAHMLLPKEYLSGLTQMLFDHEALIMSTETHSDGRTELFVDLPMRELMRNFFDELKSLSSGFASISYQPIGYREADVERLDILLAGDSVPAFTRIVSVKKVQEEGRLVVEKLHLLLPQQMIEVKIQALSRGKIVASETLKAFRKDVTGHLYGGDITRRMKLLDKQKKGKKKMQSMTNVTIPQDVFIKMMKI